MKLEKLEEVVFWGFVIPDADREKFLKNNPRPKNFMLYYFPLW